MSGVLEAICRRRSIRKYTGIRWMRVSWMPSFEMLVRNGCGRSKAGVAMRLIFREAGDARTDAVRPSDVRHRSADLVVDQISCGEPEVLTPADRIEVEGIPVFDYRVYPMANSIADKLCGIIEAHDGRPSSRVKDLVDLLVCATNENMDGDNLCHWCRLEARVRGIELPVRFAVPES